MKRLLIGLFSVVAAYLVASVLLGLVRNIRGNPLADATSTTIGALVLVLTIILAVALFKTLTRRGHHRLGAADNTRGLPTGEEPKPVATSPTTCKCNYLDDVEHVAGIAGCAYAPNTTLEDRRDTQLRDDLRERGITVLDMSMTDTRQCFFTRSVSPNGDPGAAVTACVDWVPGWQVAMLLRLAEKYAFGEVLSATEFNNAVDAIKERNAS